MDMMQKENTGFDFASLEIVDSGSYQVTDARGNDIVIEGRPLTLQIASPGTKKAVAAQFKRDENRNARVMGSVAGIKSKRTSDDDLRERTEFLMAITEGCSHSNITYKGHTGLNAIRAMYLEPKLGHIADGVEKYHQDRGNFSPDSSPTSSSASGTQPG